MAGLPDAPMKNAEELEVLVMKKAMVLMVLLLPAVLLASVTETVIPSTLDAYLAFVRCRSVAMQLVYYRKSEIRT